MARFSFLVSDKTIKVFNKIRWLDVEGAKGWINSSGGTLHMEVSMDDSVHAWYVISKLIKTLVDSLDIEGYELFEDKHDTVILMYSLTERRRLFMQGVKEYKINKTWGIRCYNRAYDNACVLEVFMLGVPWEEVVDSATFANKDDANNKFKEFVAEYKNKEAFM